MESEDGEHHSFARVMVLHVGDGSRRKFASGNFRSTPTWAMAPVVATFVFESAVFIKNEHSAARKFSSEIAVVFGHNQDHILSGIVFRDVIHSGLRKIGQGQGIPEGTHVGFSPMMAASMMAAPMMATSMMATSMMAASMRVIFTGAFFNKCALFIKEQHHAIRHFHPKFSAGFNHRCGDAEPGVVISCIIQYSLGQISRVYGSAFNAIGCVTTTTVAVVAMMTVAHLSTAMVVITVTEKTTIHAEIKFLAVFQNHLVAIATGAKNHFNLKWTVIVVYVGYNCRRQVTGAQGLSTGVIGNSFNHSKA